MYYGRLVHALSTRCNKNHRLKFKSMFEQPMHCITMTLMSDIRCSRAGCGSVNRMYAFYVFMSWLVLLLG